jgi:enoyl-CoA hydratase/carnithine racemase
VNPLSLGEARERLAAPEATESFSPVAGEPLLAVRLDAGDAPLDPIAAGALAAVPAPTVALVSDADELAMRAISSCFDVVVATDAELAAIAAAIVRAPLASAALVQLLRGGETRSIEAGLVAESFAYSTLLAGPEFRAWLATRAPRSRDAGSAGPVALRRAGAELRITLARSEKRNAYGVATRDALVEALALAAHDRSIERVVLDAEGPAFCAGGDLDEFGRAPDPATAHVVRTTRSAARLVAALADRIEVRVQGACVGAGIELAAFAGRVVAQSDAWFALPEVSMGLIPGAGGTVSLPRRIGRQRTAWLALTGARLDAETALAWGLVDQC